jgi:hypothetical protein
MPPVGLELLCYRNDVTPPGGQRRGVVAVHAARSFRWFQGWYNLRRPQPGDRLSIANLQGRAQATPLLAIKPCFAIIGTTARLAKMPYCLNQTLRLAENPGLQAAFRGERIDTFFKEAVRHDARLGHLQVTPRFSFGPDVFNPATRTWWDVTTAGRWESHIGKYTEQFGTGIKLLYGGP